jgi:hypothetical protein
MTEREAREKKKKKKGHRNCRCRACCKERNILSYY